MTGDIKSDARHLNVNLALISDQLSGALSDVRNLPVEQRALCINQERMVARDFQDIAIEGTPALLFTTTRDLWMDFIGELGHDGSLLPRTEKTARYICATPFVFFPNYRLIMAFEVEQSFGISLFAQYLKQISKIRYGKDISDVALNLMPVGEKDAKNIRAAKPACDLHVQVRKENQPKKVQSLYCSLNTLSAPPKIVDITPKIVLKQPKIKSWKLGFEDKEKPRNLNKSAFSLASKSFKYYEAMGLCENLPKYVHVRVLPDDIATNVTAQKNVFAEAFKFAVATYGLTIIKKGE